MENTGPGIDLGVAHEILVVMGFKGGIGKTTLVTNIAAACDDRAVGIVDLDAPFANVATVLRVNPDKTWSSWNGGGSAYSCTTSIRDHMYLMSCSKDKLTRSNTPTIAKVQSVIGSMKRDMPLTIVDCSSTMSEQVRAACKMATKILVVSTLDQTSIQNSLQMLQELQLKVPVKWVFNRVDTRMPFSTREFEVETGYRVAMVLPEDKRVVKAVRKGKLMVDRYKRAKWTRIVHQYVSNAEMEQRGNLFDRLICLFRLSNHGSLKRPIA